MKYTVEIEIEEIPTEIVIHFDMTYGDVDVTKIVAAHSGQELSEDLMTHELYNECAEYYADQMAERRGSRKVNYNGLKSA